MVAAKLPETFSASALWAGKVSLQGEGTQAALLQIQ